MEEEDEPQSYENLCRLCGEGIEEGSRKVKKEKIANLFKRFYDVTINHDPKWLPRTVHFTCSNKLNYASKTEKAPPPLKTFPPLTGPRKKRKKLMDISETRTANKRIKPVEEVLDKYCGDEGEDKEDVLRYMLQQELYKRGKRKQAQQLKMMDKTLDPLPSKSKPMSPLTPKTTLARVVVSKRSFNEYKEDFRFLRQKKKQVYSGPTATNEEKLKINQKAVEFTLTDKTTGRSFHYEPPQPPVKPCMSGYNTRAEKRQAWKRYSSELSEYRLKLQPNHLQSDHTLPEEVRSHHLGMLFFKINSKIMGFYFSKTFHLLCDE